MGALDGYKVLDFTTLLPGPYATMTLADLGAEMGLSIRIQRQEIFDAMHRI